MNKQNKDVFPILEEYKTLPFYDVLPCIYWYPNSAYYFVLKYRGTSKNIQCDKIVCLKDVILYALQVIEKYGIETGKSSIQYDLCNLLGLED